MRDEHRLAAGTGRGGGGDTEGGGRLLRNAIEGLPMEDLESIMEFIRFVREQRRRRDRAER